MDFEYDSSASSSSYSYSCNSGNSPSPVQLPPSTTITHKRKAGRKKFRETRHPFFRGVRQRNGEKWVCEVREPHKKSRIWLGTYASPEMAARAYDVAALALRGKAAPLNFPDSAWLLTRAKSSSARDIQLAALEAAETFRPVTKPVILSTTNSSSFHACVELPSVKKVEKCPSTFLDEEALFNMPGLIASMAEGLLLTPPGMQKGFNWDGVEDEVELSLWSK